MAEKDFQTELGRGLTAAGFYYKIVDQPVSQMVKARFTEAKPFDCWWIVKGIPVGLELKQVRGLSLNAGDRGHLRPHQEEQLLRLVDHGGLGLVVVNFQHKLPEKKAKKLGYSVVDRAFAVSIQQVVAARTELASDTLPLEWMARAGVELQCAKQDGKRFWQVDQLAAYVLELAGGRRHAA